MNKYEIIYQEKNKKLKKILEIKGQLDNSYLPKNLISIRRKTKEVKTFKDEIVINILNELNLILHSNINFNEALKIVDNSRHDEQSKEFINLIYKLLIEQKDVETTLKDLKINETVKLFFILISKTGEIKNNLNALNTILKEEKSLKSKFLKKLSYPIFLFASFIFSLIALFSFVIPKFKNLIKEENASFATKSLFFMENMFSNYLVYMFIILIVIIFCFTYMFIRNKNKIDKFLFKSLIFYRYYELYKIFLLIEVFLKGKYEFYIAFSNSSYLIKNKYLLDKISLCNSLLYKGKSIAFSFDKAEIFDDIVINLINIAQQTNSIETISSDIKMIYKQKFDRSFDVFIGIIQPVFLIFMTFLILWIVMGIFIPLWDVSNIISL